MTLTPEQVLDAQIAIERVVRRLGISEASVRATEDVDTETGEITTNVTLVASLLDPVARKVFFAFDGSTDENGARAFLEHTDTYLQVHSRDKCMSDVVCTIHKRSWHMMRGYPQSWRADRGMIERICDHGIGHPDPDDPAIDRTHGCDGCCDE